MNCFFNSNNDKSFCYNVSLSNGRLIVNNIFYHSRLVEKELSFIPVKNVSNEKSIINALMKTNLNKLKLLLLRNNFDITKYLNLTEKTLLDCNWDSELADVLLYVDNIECSILARKEMNKILLYENQNYDNCRNKGSEVVKKLLYEIELN